MNIFENYPNLEKCFATSDGEHFYNENDAKNHSKSLEDKSVEPVYNPSFLQVEDTEELSDEELEMKAFEESEKMNATVEDLKDTPKVDVPVKPLKPTSKK